jgi:hypothetical protein
MAITAMQIRTPAARVERGGDCAASRCTDLIEPPVNLFTSHSMSHVGSWIKRQPVIYRYALNAICQAELRQPGWRLVDRV